MNWYRTGNVGGAWASLDVSADDPKFYTARTKRAVNSLTVERGPKVGAE